MRFPHRQERRKIPRGKPLPCCSIGRRLLGEGLIIDPATAPKGPSKYLALLGRGIASVAVGAFHQIHTKVFFFCRKEAAP